MAETAVSSRRVSATQVERSLAALLVGLLGVYTMSVAGGELFPAVDTAGLIAVHLAVVVAGVFPLAVLGHAAQRRRGADTTGPRTIETLTAVIALGSLATTLWLSLGSASQFGTALLGCTIGSLLILVGLVANRS